MVCARKASERPARARSQVQDRDRSQELDRQKVESLAQKTGATQMISRFASGRALFCFKGFDTATDKAHFTAEALIEPATRNSG